ncbi:ComEC/Rec2 family competence protein [Pontibacter cellulosilyticus]|uniref:ComEC family competence protein n=1 Tax=Pontibacter cellulosilyticus TaxID=1720253 RepID=A0A923SIB9_9BACT|nr:ComEC/Rec2 family competence protein [Pontibacter cellulosilyticus]MBC5992588.1 ComEC family competence protein [Pontibacter cellulosilyticus]
MLRWAPYPFVRITLSFIAGILLYIVSGREFRYTFELLAFFFVAFVVAAILSKKYKSALATNIAGIIGLLSFFAAGLFTAHYRTDSHHPQHLVHLKTMPTHYVGVVEDYVLQKPGYQSTVLQVEQVKINGQWQQAKGKVQLLSVPHDSEQQYELAYGDRLLVKGAPQAVAPPLNPAQFDYRKYLANKNIYHQHYLQTYQYQKLGSEPKSDVLYFSIQLRRQLDNLLQARLDEQREYGISSALILGVKDELDNSIRNAYSQTGTMHVLAVSGLHVGLIFSVLMLVLAKLNRNVQQRVLGAILTLSILWLYAFITGLSPSVLRAVLMFSLVTIGMALGRNTNIYNTVSIAALVLLFINPYNLLEVGFQLSFVAVLGIVYLQPRFYKLLEINNWLLDKVWALFTVAMAAQLATFPLGLFYFHQFPVYFWLANLVVVPLATFVLWSGVSALALSWVPGLSWLLFKIHFGFIWCMNEFNLWVQQLPQAIINGIDITLFQTVLLYLLLLAFILFMALKKLRYLSLATSIVAILSVQEIWETVQQREQNMQAVYSLRGSTGVAVIAGQQAVLIADSALMQNQSNYTFNVQSHFWQHGVQEPQFVSLEESIDVEVSSQVLPDGNHLLIAKGKRWLILSKPIKVQPSGSFVVDYVLLRRNAQIKPEELQVYTFDKVILDGSNSPWYRERMRKEFETASIAYHDVMKDGAFLVE